MIIFRCSLALAIGLLPSFGAAQDIALPSGRTVTLVEVIWESGAEPDELWARFRFLAPWIAGRGDEGLEWVAPDLAALCRETAVPAIARDGRQAAGAVVSLSDRPIAFGESNSDITQFFEAFRIKDGVCMLEVF